jgi:MFS family permease
VSNTLPTPCDALTARTKDGTNPPAHPRLVIATAILASSLALIDSSVVNVGLPAISRSFDADAVGLQWVVNAYLLPLSALLLLGGAVGDRFGRRRLLIAGVILFCIASLACSVAPTLPFLQFARFGQGASAAMLMPNSLAKLRRRSKRPRDCHLGGQRRRCRRRRPCSRWMADRWMPVAGGSHS